MSLSETDHDLLIRIDTRLEGLERDLHQLQVQALKDIASLDVRTRFLEDIVTKFNPKDFTDKYDRWGKDWEAFSQRKGVWITVLLLSAGLVSNVLRLVVLPLLGFPK
jgi:hypothetical protein